MSRPLNGIAVVALAAFAALPAGGQSVCMPFGQGEQLTYGVKAARLGARGKLVMSVSGPEALRGHQALVLRSEASVGVGFVKGSDKSASWVDPVRLATLRYTQRERHVVSRSNDSVEVFPDERRWERSDGRKGETLTSDPLDVLSYIYYLRTLPLAVGATWTLNRHLDNERNPTIVTVIGRDSLQTPAGRYTGWNVEMHVRDKDHYGGSGTLRLLISDDEFRLPVRIESEMPVVGAAVMTLTGVQRAGAGSCAVPGTRQDLPR
ncbi:MAG: DUF3108 domain-containing protein [Gemmatimonadota bacterium]|nr:DUF3108 domain-containing protein [Gemmatimonadota bacterium]